MSPRASLLSLALPLLAGCGSTPPAEAPEDPARGKTASDPARRTEPSVERELPGKRTPVEPARARPDPAPGAAASDAPSAPVQASKRPNGLRVLTLPTRPGELAHLGIYIEAGPARDRSGKPGLAALCARSLRRAGGGHREGEVLDETLDALDAELRVSLAGRYVRVEASCPRERAPELARVLFRFLQAKPSRDVVAHAQRDLLRELESRRPQRARQNDVRLLLGERVPSLVAEEESVASFSAPEVQLFIGLHYRPNNAVLAVQIPPGSSEDDETHDEVVTAFDTWKSDARLAPLPAAGKVLQLGFARRPSTSAEVIAIVRSPAPAITGSGKDEVAWQTLAMDGYGGPLRRRLDAAGFADLVPAFEEIDTGWSHVRALVLRVPQARTADLVKALMAGFADLAGDEPDFTALRVAKRRALFLWDLELSDPTRRMRAFVRSTLLGQRPGLEDRVVRSVEQVRPDDVPDLARQRLVPSILVRGPTAAVPDGARPVPPPYERRTTTTDVARVKPLELEPADVVKLRDVILERVRQALGGTDALRATERIEFEAECRFAAAIPFRERWSIAVATGASTREREVLATKVTVRPKGDGYVEVAGPDERPLTKEEAGLFELERLAHPTLFFATQLQQELPVQLIGKLPANDNALLVLEWKTQGETSFRVAVDQRNGLPRRIEYMEWQPKAAPRQVTLVFQHFRAAGALRAPGLVKKFVDDEYRGEKRLSYLNR